MKEHDAVFRMTIGLIGLAVMGALFAGFVGRSEQGRAEYPAFRLGPGEARSDHLQTVADGESITIDVAPPATAYDVYVLDSRWADALAVGGDLNLHQPFSFLAEFSHTNVTGALHVVLPGDGETSYALVFDHGDNYYDNDAVPDDQDLALQVTIRYPDEERRSLLLGAIATIPSILLVAITLGRGIRKWRGRRLTKR